MINHRGCRVGPLLPAGQQAGGQWNFHLCKRELKHGDSLCCSTSESTEPAQKDGIVERVAERGAGQKLADLLQGGTLSQTQRIQRVCLDCQKASDEAPRHRLLKKQTCCGSRRKALP